MFNAIKSGISRASKQTQLVFWQRNIQNEKNRMFLTLSKLHRVSAYGYFGENLLFKFKVLSNMDNLIEDDRKAEFFKMAVEKYGESDLKKVQICATEVLKQIEDLTYKAQVREGLIDALKKKQLQLQLENPKSMHAEYYFEILQIRLELIDEYIKLDLKPRARTHLAFLKDVYKKLESIEEMKEQSNQLAHTYVISNIQIQNFEEAQIFAKILRTKLLQKSKSFPQNNNAKKSSDETASQLSESISVSFYFWQILASNEKTFEAGLTELDQLMSKCSNDLGIKKLNSILTPDKLVQFEEQTLNAFETLISKKMFKKAAGLFAFYSQNMFQNKDILLKISNVPSHLHQIDFLLNHIKKSSNRFAKLPAILEEDQSIFSHSVKDYYKYSIQTSKAIGINLELFRENDLIKKTIHKKFSKNHTDAVFSYIYDFENNVEEQKAEPNEDPRLKKQPKQDS